MSEVPPRPQDDVDEDELTAEDIAYFKGRLLAEREAVIVRLRRHAEDALSDAEPIAEEGDQATQISEQAYHLRLADKERKLLAQIDRALDKVKEGEFGICEGTGDPVPRKRLELRPWTRYSVEYKEMLEKAQGKQHRR